MKKNILCLLFLLASAFAQNPLTVSQSDNSITLTNSGQKEIIAVLVTASVPLGRFDYSHDYFAQAHGLAVGSTVTTKTPKPPTDIKVVFVQFADGTVYGDQTLMSAIAANRRQVASMLLDLVTTYETQGEAAFKNTLANYTTGIEHEQHLPSRPKATASMIQSYYEQFGITQTITKLKGRIAAANARWATGQF